MQAAVVARVAVVVITGALAWLLLRLGGPGATGVHGHSWRLRLRVTSANLVSFMAAVMAIVLGSTLALTG